MHIIAGSLKGRALNAPRDDSTRPTSGKVRGALFNILAHGSFGPLPGEDTRVLDCFCGSGALGLEALSRGAAYALFLDSRADALAVAKSNALKLGAAARCGFELRDLSQKQNWRGAAFNLIFLDPPYREARVPRTLACLEEGGFIAPGAVAVAETARDEDLPPLPGWKLESRRAWGGTAAFFLRREAS